MSRIPQLIRPVAVPAFYAAVKLLLVLRKPTYKFLVVLGHMRSGSTLLSHILISHPDFVGFGESNLTYQTDDDFKKLVLMNCHYLHRLWLTEPIIVDQINHNQMLQDGALNAVYRAIILTREKSDTIKSLLKMFPSWTVEDANAYYAGRLKGLDRYRSLLGSRAISITYEDLTERTDDTLSRVSQFLSLRVPLSARYDVKPTTGKIGDPSKNIQAGRILRRDLKDAHPNLNK